MPAGENVIMTQTTLNMLEDSSIKRSTSGLPHVHQTRPMHISLEDIPNFESLSISCKQPSSSCSVPEDPYDPLLSPDLPFYTAPSTPVWDTLSDEARSHSETNLDLFTASVFNRQNISSHVVQALHHRSSLKDQLVESPKDGAQASSPPPPSPGLTERPSLLDSSRVSFHSGSPVSSTLTISAHLDSPVPPSASTQFTSGTTEWHEPPSRLSSPTKETSSSTQDASIASADLHTDVAIPIETFPTFDIPLDLSLDDEGLDPLGKIYLFSQSPVTHHRVYIAQALPLFLAQINSNDAVEYVLPHLNGLAIDEEEVVVEAFASQLSQIIWWFLTNCPIFPENDADIMEDVAYIQACTFTPIIGTLLLSANGVVGGPTRFAVVDILDKIRHIEDSSELTESAGVLDHVSRRMVWLELLNEVVIGMGRLDLTDSSLLAGMSPTNSQDGHHDSGARKFSTDGSQSSQPDSDGQVDLDRHAAVGRLASMSLIASVVASGPIEQEIVDIFIEEIHKAATDSVYWVRREASFALGAVAKILSPKTTEEILLPLYNLLWQDGMWHVRHSSIFALPALLSRLPIHSRNPLVIEAGMTLCQDESPVVRSGLLEALGELIHTYHNISIDPPQELIELYIGHIGQVPPSPTLASLSAFHITAVSDRSHIIAPLQQTPIDAFFSDAARPLICAFSLPAVALTLGKMHWPTLRPLYQDLTTRRTIKVRRTLAASVGELAKIVGSDTAFQDLLPAWMDAIHCEDDSDVRLNAIEALDGLLGVLEIGKGREDVARELIKVWGGGNLKGWRERLCAVHVLPHLLSTEDQVQMAAEGVFLALTDDVAAVREGGITMLPLIWRACAEYSSTLSRLESILQELSQSVKWRQRAAYVSCQFHLAMKVPRLSGIDYAADEFWKTLSVLGVDPIVGVRIGVARMAALLAFEISHIPTTLSSLLSTMRRDASHEVRAFTEMSKPLGNEDNKREHAVYSISRPPFSKLEPS